MKINSLSWHTVKFSDIVEISGGSTPSTRNPDYWNGDIPWITPKDITKNSTVHVKKTHRMITEFGLKNGPGNLYPPGHVLMSSRAPVGIPVINDVPMAVNQGFIAINCKKIDNHFLYYWIKNNLAYLEQMSNGTTFLELSQSVFATLEITLPKEIQHQKKIGKFLFDLDSKIESIQSQNEILEKIIKVTFKSWFIDFDGQIEFVDSELGKIPKGWEVGKLSQLAKNIKNSISSSEINSTFNYIGLEHMPRGSIILSKWDNAENVKSNKFQFKNKHILFGKLRPYFKKVGFAPIDGICSTDILVIDSIDPDFYAYILEILCSDHFINYNSMASTGTKMPRTDWKIMSEYDIVIPTKNILLKFNTIANSFLENIQNNIFEVKQLEKIRNSMLPKLMSGEIEL